MSMKRLLLTAILALSVSWSFAKSTYIPTYNNKIILIEDGQMNTLENQRQLLQLDSKDNLISCQVVQQVVSPDLINAIKRAKRSAGWSMALSGLAGASNIYSDVRLFTGNARGYDYANAVVSGALSREAAEASANSYAQAEELMTLMVDFVVKNNSDKEMMITDIDRGLMWFILPHQEAILPLAKGEECHFRVSSSAPLTENVKYINVSANSFIEKYTVALETDSYWYLPISERVKDMLGFDTSMEEGYIKVDKESMKKSAVSPEDFKEIKAGAKN